VAAVIAVALSTGAMACGAGTGGESGRPGDESSRKPTSHTPDLPRGKIRTPTRKDVETLAGVRVPASASEIEGRLDPGGPDAALWARFAVDRADVERFVKSAGLTRPPERCRRGGLCYAPIQANETTRQLGWRLDGIERYLAHSEQTTDRALGLMIDLEQAARPVVYLFASTR